MSDGNVFTFPRSGGAGAVIHKPALDEHDKAEALVWLEALREAVESDEVSSMSYAAMLCEEPGALICTIGVTDDPMRMMGMLFHQASELSLMVGEAIAAQDDE